MMEIATGPETSLHIGVTRGGYRARASVDTFEVLRAEIGEVVRVFLAHQASIIEPV